MYKKLIKDDNNIYHIVYALSYNESTTKSMTKCGQRIKINNESDNIYVPVDLLNIKSICWKCNRSQMYLDDKRFPPYDNNSKYTFFIKATFKYGKNRGDLHMEIIHADSVKKAKNKFETIYHNLELHEYHQISKRVETDWITIYEK